MSDSPSPLILSLETATRAGSVALARGPRLLAMRAGETQDSHSTKLLNSVADLLKEAGFELNDVELYAAASGPGSFTGLRIGLATVKSFAATLKRPCVGVPTLAAIAVASGPSAQTVAMIPAGRGEVFAQLFEVDEEGRATPHGEAVHRAPSRLLDSLPFNALLKFAGEGAIQHSALIKERAEREGIRFVSEEAESNVALREGERLWLLARTVGPLAPTIAIIASQCYMRGESFGPEGLRALYVRPSDAELNEPQR